ncbi:MAG: NUDIX domain-containing protein [Candidatus Pacearchaeota archaeon]|jgi:isopentenyldiphosphate isomerase
MKIIIVDKEDNVIGSKERGNIDYEKDIYRVSALWITNTKGKILLARRAFNKKQNPGKWGPAVAGTNDEGETYESNIIKEAEEELGLKNIKPQKGVKELVEGKYTHFTQWFYLVIDKNIKEFNYLKKEVAEIEWFTKEEVLNLIKINSDEVLKEMKNWINLF